ncbi:MAG: RDD family protein [Planctomycetota bacterium]
MCRRVFFLYVAGVLSLALGLAASHASAQDLLVAGDESHLWLVVASAGEDGEQIEIYHRGPGDAEGQLHALEPIAGRVRSGSIAAGGGRLVLVMDDGRVLTRRPYKEPMGWGWSYRTGDLPALPEGCGLLSLVANRQGVWALVRVDAPEVLAELDAPPTVSGAAAMDDTLNAALGLPPGIDLWGPGDGRDEAVPEDAGDGSAEHGQERPIDAGDGTSGADASADDDVSGTVDNDAPRDANAGDEAVPAETEQVPAASGPACRLIRVGAQGWKSVPLPDAFGLPHRAELVMRGPRDARPVVVSEHSRGEGALVVTLPAGEADWSQNTYYLPGRGGWSAASLLGQVFVAVERQRDVQQVVVDVFLLRGRHRANAGMMWVNTLDTARWRLLGLGSEAVLLARPDAPLEPGNGVASGDSPERLLGEYRLPAAMLGTVPPPEGGEPAGTHTDYYPARRSRWENNADWIIQIVALTAALAILMLFWKRTPREREVRLPEGVRLVPWSRRLLSTLIDLMPGLWIAGGVYGLGWDEIILQHWPGTPIPKHPDAMGPGWLVIAITVLHTTVFEFITARSVGKWLTGTYVSDFRGVPASPGASLVRAVSRVFELVAWLLLMLPLISPQRQRLGDILAKTIVVYRDPPAPEEGEDGEA